MTHSLKIDSSQERPTKKQRGEKNAHYINNKNRLLKALATKPKMPPPSTEEMLNMLRSGKYMELVPYFKEEIGSVRSHTGARLRIMKALDPAAYRLELDKLNESHDRYLMRKGQKKTTSRTSRQNLHSSAEEVDPAVASALQTLQEVSNAPSDPSLNFGIPPMQAGAMAPFVPDMFYDPSQFQFPANYFNGALEYLNPDLDITPVTTMSEGIVQGKKIGHISCASKTMTHHFLARFSRRESFWSS
jgi:hypothetical protein